MPNPMPKGTIEINDRDDLGLPAVELGDILPLLESEGRSLTWAIQNLYAVGDLYRLGRTMRDFGDEVGQTPGGATLNWDELEEFSRSVFQIMDARIIGFRGPRRPGAAADDDQPTEAEFVIEAIDASRWRFSAANDEVLRRFCQVFRDWKMTTDH